MKNSEYKIHWDYTIRMEKSNNRPDMVILNKKEKKGQIIGITVSYSINMQTTYEEKINTRKYGELKERIRKLWKVERIEIVHYPLQH